MQPARRYPSPSGSVHPSEMLENSPAWELRAEASGAAASVAEAASWVLASWLPAKGGVEIQPHSHTARNRLFAAHANTDEFTR